MQRAKAKTPPLRRRGSLSGWTTRAASLTADARFTSAVGRNEPRAALLRSGVADKQALQKTKARW